jgi:hypothetical protein
MAITTSSDESGCELQSPTVAAQSPDAAPDSVLAQARNLHTETMAILTRAVKEGDSDLSLKAIREARAGLEMLGKVLAQVDADDHVALVEAPEWRQLRSALLRVLEAYPEVRQQVAQVLIEAENELDA